MEEGGLECGIKEDMLDRDVNICMQEKYNEMENQMDIRREGWID